MVVAVALLYSVGHVFAQEGPYLQMSLGVPVAPTMAVSGTDDDWGTKCDRILNPNGVEVTNECAAAPAASAWQNEIGGGVGHRSGLAVGYRWGALRVEGEYSHRTTIYDGRADLNIFDDVTLDKREQEIELAIGGVDDLQAHTLFANAYYDVAAVGSVTLYVGVGMGVDRVSLAYSSHWKRNDDPARITTFVDPTLRATIAGTTTIGAARLTDYVTGYQVLAGAEYQLNDPITLGLTFRRVDFGRFESTPTEWNQLRSHDSTVGLDERILHQVTTDDSRFRYQF